MMVEEHSLIANVCPSPGIIFDGDIALAKIILQANVCRVLAWRGNGEEYVMPGAVDPASWWSENVSISCREAGWNAKIE